MHVSPAAMSEAVTTASRLHALVREIHVMTWHTIEMSKLTFEWPQVAEDLSESFSLWQHEQF